MKSKLCSTKDTPVFSLTLTNKEQPTTKKPLTIDDLILQNAKNEDLVQQILLQNGHKNVTPPSIPKILATEKNSFLSIPPSDYYFYGSK
ncbi:unnamed protein product [Gordionus sp. m RMFG-2023]